MNFGKRQELTSAFPYINLLEGDVICENVIQSMKKEVSYETFDWFAIAMPDSDFRSG